MKRNIFMKISSIVLYVLTFALFVLAASMYSLSVEYAPIVLAVLAIACLYLGLFINDRRLRHFPKTFKGDAKSEKPKKSFFKRSNVIVMIVAFCLIFVSSFSAMCVNTNGFKVEVSSFTLTQAMTKQYNNGEINGKQYVMANDTTYSVTMYKPKDATETNKAPTIFVVPGFTRTKATMYQYCIEFARRGAVVFCIDPGGQGDTTETSTAGGNGVEYLVQYVYNNTVDYNFCDRDRFGAMGHSAGGGNACTLAADMAGSTYEESVIKALYISGYIKLSSANKYQKLRCNTAMSYAYYDEGVFRYQEEINCLEAVSKMFVNDVNGKNTNANKYCIVDKEYGSMADGTYRVFHREKINHCFEMYDNTSIANTINFFDVALGMNSGIEGTSQVWFFKEFSNGIALASAFTFIISLCFVLMDTKFFVTIKAKNQPAVVAERRTRSVGKKITFWTLSIISAVIACLDYIPLANLSIKIFPVHNSSSVYTYTFPARMVNAILLWAVVNGIIGLILYFGEMLIDNLIEKVRAKKAGRPAQYEWAKIKVMRVDGNRFGRVIANIGKILLLCAIMIGSFYGLDALCLLLFGQDFRFMLVSASNINTRMLLTALEYIPLIFVFYLCNALKVNGSIAREGYNEFTTTLIGAIANSIGLVFILIINYVCFFETGSPFYGYWGNGTEVWLYINMVFALIVMMFILPIFNRLLYKKTGSVWVGAIVCCFIFVMMTICASVSYIPFY